MTQEQPAPALLEGPRERQLIAPVLHTMVLVLLLVGFSYLGANTKLGFTEKYGRSPLYLSTMAWEWVLLGYVWMGVRRRLRLRDLIGGRWNRVEDALMDVAVAAGFWMVSALVLGAIGYALGLQRPEQVSDVKHRLGHIIPASPVETALWLGLSATAGFCEEIIFRGYLQRQFGAIAGDIWWGVVMQGLLFGAAHGYEGWRRMIQIAVYGAMFGMLALLRRSLRPGIMAHFAQDTIAGIAARFVLK